MINLIRFFIWVFAVLTIINRIGGWTGFWIVFLLVVESYLGDFEHYLAKEELKKEYDKATKNRSTVTEGNPKT